MLAAEDVRTQRNGVTLILFAIGNSIRRHVDIQSILQMPKVSTATPLFVGGIHFCYEDKVAARVYPNPITLVQLAVDALGRMRFRTHHGT